MISPVQMRVHLVTNLRTTRAVTQGWYPRGELGTFCDSQRCGLFFLDCKFRNFYFLGSRISSCIFLGSKYFILFFWVENFHDYFSSNLLYFSWNSPGTAVLLLKAVIGKSLISDPHEFNPILAGLFLFSLTGGWILPPLENDVPVELGQWNLAHFCTCLKTTPVSNLVELNPWRHYNVINVSLTAISKVSRMFVYQDLSRYKSIASVFIWLSGMLECCSVHSNWKIAESFIKRSNSALQKPLK